MSSAIPINPTSSRLQFNETLCNLRFESQISIDHSVDGKLLANWDEISWKPLVLIASSLRQLCEDIISANEIDASVEKYPPYARPESAYVELGDDIVIQSRNEIPKSDLTRIQDACILFANQVCGAAEPSNKAFDFSDRLSPADKEVADRHVDSFRIANGNKAIPEAFICSIGETQIVFAKSFCKKLVTPSGSGKPLPVVAKIEGAERNDERGSCLLRLSDDGTRVKVPFVVEPMLLVRIREALWDDCYYLLNILDIGTGGGKSCWQLMGIGNKVQSGTPLFDSLPPPPSAA